VYNLVEQNCADADKIRQSEFITAPPGNAAVLIRTQTSSIPSLFACVKNAARLRRGASDAPRNNKYLVDHSRERPAIQSRVRPGRRDHGRRRKSHGQMTRERCGDLPQGAKGTNRTFRFCVRHGERLEFNVIRDGTPAQTALT